MGFNPRPRTGGDIAFPFKIDGMSGFNPRPRTGGDLLECVSNVPLGLFQSTPPYGGRHQAGNSGPDRYCFNPRPRTGGDCSFITF